MAQVTSIPLEAKVYRDGDEWWVSLTAPVFTNGVVVTNGFGKTVNDAAEKAINDMMTYLEVEKRYG